MGKTYVITILHIRMLTMPDKSTSPYSFVIASFVCFRWQVLRTMPPRLAITGFTYSQTFLINAAIRYLETPAPLRNTNHAYGLIGATALIYIGIAASPPRFPCQSTLTISLDSHCYLFPEALQSYFTVSWYNCVLAVRSSTCKTGWLQ
jgi:hypothetical protein